MAYGKIYTALVKPLNPTAHGSVIISIYKRDYVGAESFITINEDQVSFRRNFEDWSSHLIGMTLVMAIQNTAANYFDFIGLMKAKEKEYLVIAEHGYQLTFTRIFEGYINVELTTQKYLKYQQINIVASSYIKKLETHKPASIETLQNKTFIDIISECLSATGSTANIRVNTSYVPEEDVPTITSGQTFLNLTGIYTEIFWKNNVDRESSFKILEEICKTFSLYLYWWNNRWYIEQYSELWGQTKTYVEYTNGVSYGPADEGVVVEETNPIRLIKSLVFSEMSQVLSCLPGVRKNSIRLELSEYLNLTIADFTGIVAVGTDNPIPPLREWRKWQPLMSVITWDAQGDPFKTLANSIHCTISDGIDGHWYDYYYRGLYTQFQAQMVQEKTSLKLSYKVGLETFTFLPKPYTSYTYKFYWYLNVLIPDIQNTPSGYVFVGWKIGPYVMWSDANNRWELNYTSGNNEKDALQEVIRKAEDFDDNKIVNIDISISDIWGLNEQPWFFVFGIGLAIAEYENIIISPYTRIFKDFYVGDVQISISGTEDEPNLIEGEINEDYLIEKEESLMIGDIASVNFKNGILRGAELESRTTKWFSPDSPPTRPIIDWKLAYLTKLNNTTRQRLTGSVIYKKYSTLIQIEGEIGLSLYEDMLLRPFTLFTEDKQANLKYILTGISDHNPKHQKFVIQLDEYDNETELNIIS